MTETVHPSKSYSNLDRAMIACGVPDRHRTARYQTHRSGWSTTFIGMQDRKPDALIALLGPNGTGKTQLAVEVIRRDIGDKFSALQHCERGYTVDHLQVAGTCLYRTAAELAGWVKDAYSNYGWSEKGALATYVQPHLLVIDEFDKRGDSVWEHNLFTNLLDTRYGQKRATILIANSEVDDFQKLVGPSIASRMNETGGVLVCDWPSFRGIHHDL